MNIAQSEIRSGILILDFGSQYTQLIARRYREMGVYSEIHPYNLNIKVIQEMNPAAIVLSGGPQSVTDKDAYLRDINELLEVAPLLGICYGMQLITQYYGGSVSKATHREYGYSDVQWNQSKYSFDYASKFKTTKVWMSHGDTINKIPENFELVAQSENNVPAAIENERILCFQFHAEVTHTEKGAQILESFLIKAPDVKKNWKPRSIIESLTEKYKSEVCKDEKILCGLSGGVDSSVTAVLLTQIFGPEKVICIFVDNGLLRKNEFQEVLDSYDGMGLNVKGVDAKKEFYEALKNKSDPEEKRIAIGHTFIKIFKANIPQGEKIKWLAQGTLYPDVIESVSPTGSSVTIKSHHNVGGLPKDLNMQLIEPLRLLFKDEVRRLGKELDMSQHLLERHPFPGPGLGIRILGEVTQESVKILQEADSIFINEIKAAGLYNEIWQAFAVLLPVRAVGVQGDSRTYDKVIALRAVSSIDGMTANWYPFTHDILSKISNRITNEVKGVNRVVYDISSKPPGTIEWE